MIAKFKASSFKDKSKLLVAQFKTPSFLFYLFVVIVITAQFIITSNKLADDTFYPMPSFRYLLKNHLCDALFLSAFYWLLPSRRKGWVWVLITLTTVWCFAQITYNETYADMMPFSSWLYFKNLGGELFDSILGTITTEAIVVLALPLLLLVVWLFWLRKRIKSDNTFKKQRWLLAAVSVLLPVIFQFSSVAISSIKNHNSFGKEFSLKYSDFVNFKAKVYPIKNGNVPFIIYSICKAFTGISKEEKQHAKEFISKEVPTYTDNPYCLQSNPPRNVILLMVESLNAWVIDLKIDGREVCPVLNRLVADSTAIACTQMMAQVKNGRSSDGMFMYNTGILPLTTQSVAMDYGDNEFPSFAKALKGVNPAYHSMEITVDRKGMWNVETTASSYGFDKLYLQDCYREAYVNSGQSIDKALLEFASATLSQAREPFYAMIFTGSTHIPYNKLEEISPTWISQSSSYTTNVRNYLEKVAFFDRQLGAFIQRIKESGVYDNTVLVIASDHSDFVDNEENGRPSISKKGIECMFVILNSKLPGRRINGPVGQIDLYPTLLDIMGANSYWWKGLGHSLLRNDVKSAVPAPGETAGDKSSKLLHHQQDAWGVSNTLIKTNWWKK